MDFIWRIVAIVILIHDPVCLLFSVPLYRTLSPSIHCRNIIHDAHLTPTMCVTVFSCYIRDTTR
jgi:hypothetical protein